MQTIVTWNGERFEPLDHEDYRAARGYVAEFVAFHGTEGGCSSRRAAPDIWRIDAGRDILTIEIVAPS